MTRKRIVWLMVIGGFALQVIAYLFLAAPIGSPTGPEFSQPRLLGAPIVFICGVLLVFLSAVVYELLPPRAGDE